MKGKVKWYNIRQGYGFIEGEDGIDVFVHKSEVPFWTIFLSAGDKVEYLIEKTKRGLIARNLKIL
jgi:CspA family cold shock protein